MPPATGCWSSWPGGCAVRCAATRSGPTPRAGWGATSSCCCCARPPWKSRAWRSSGCCAWWRSPTSSTPASTRCRSPPAWVPPSTRSTAAMPTPCCATPTMRCTAPSRPGATATSSSTPRTGAATKSASWPSAACRRRWTRPSSRCTTSPRWTCAAVCVLGLEALLRWDHPQHGLIAPMQFLPLIENTGLSSRVGDWVLGQALEHLAMWRRAGHDISVSVNVSARHLQEPDFALRLSRTAGPLPRCTGHRARAGGAGDRGPCRHRSHLGAAGALPRHGRALCARRFRHRLFDADLPEAAAGGRAEDRPLLRAPHARRRARTGPSSKA